MNLNDIQLSSHALAALYKDTLVEMSAQPATNEKVNDPSPWQFLGDNKKWILIIVNYPDVAHLPDTHLSFLTNLLTACKLSLGDVAVMNINRKMPFDITEALPFFKSRIVFLFDTEPGSINLPINFPHFQIQPFDGATYLSAPALQELESDNVLKSKLWVCFKRLFNL